MSPVSDHLADSNIQHYIFNVSCHSAMLQSQHPSHKVWETLSHHTSPLSGLRSLNIFLKKTTWQSRSVCTALWSTLNPSHHGSSLSTFRFSLWFLTHPLRFNSANDKQIICFTNPVTKWWLKSNRQCTGNLSMLSVQWDERSLFYLSILKIF